MISSSDSYSSRMGYDKTRFKGEVDEELICTICSGVFEEPLQSPICEHVFCGPCIKECLSHNNKCPVCREPMKLFQLKPAFRLLKNLLSKLNVECDYKSFGCESIVKLDLLSIHCKECDFNPKKATPCGSGCGLIMPKDELKDHNCVRELRNEVKQQRDQILKLQQTLQQQHQQLLQHVQYSLQNCTEPEPEPEPEPVRNRYFHNQYRLPPMISIRKIHCEDGCGGEYLSNVKHNCIEALRLKMEQESNQKSKQQLELKQQLQHLQQQNYNN